MVCLQEHYRISLNEYFFVLQKLISQNRIDDIENPSESYKAILHGLYKWFSATFNRTHLPLFAYLICSAFSACQSGNIEAIEDGSSVLSDIRDKFNSIFVDKSFDIGSKFQHIVDYNNFPYLIVTEHSSSVQIIIKQMA